MSKNAIIFHGTDCAPDSKYYWYAWLKKELEAHGYTVQSPYYPESNHENIETFLPKVLENHEFNEDTVLIGHSSGVPLILSILEHTEGTIKFSALVAGYSTQLSDQSDSPILQDTYNWEKIKAHSNDFVFFNSVNDPWGCDDKQGRVMFEHLGGTQIIRNDGHFGSEGKDLPYVEFPLLRDIILEKK